MADIDRFGWSINKYSLSDYRECGLRIEGVVWWTGEEKFHSVHQIIVVVTGIVIISAATYYYCCCTAILLSFAQILCVALSVFGLF